jgi:hypothetical protein
MLKRLFISLLILSALTSEGINALPANIYNLYVNMSRDLSVSGRMAETVPQVQDKSGQVASYAKGAGGASFVLSSRSAALLKLHAVTDGCFEFVFPTFYTTVTECVFESAIPLIKDRIFSKTDVSPPVYTL